MFNISKRNNGVLIEDTNGSWSMQIDRPILEVSGSQLTFWDERQRVTMGQSEINQINGAAAPVVLADVITKVRDEVLAVDKTVVGTSRDKFRDEFFNFDTVNNWDLIQTGAGQVISVLGAAGGARFLNINTGIAVNSETIFQSKGSYRFPVKLAFALSMSQRIVNQEVFVELVSVNAAGVVETDVTFPSTNFNNALNAVGYKFDNTTATNAIYSVRGCGISELISASTGVTVTTLATGSFPNFLPAGIFEINSDMEEMVFQTRAIDSIVGANLIGKRTQYIPDPGKDYKIRIRVRNLGTAPASATDVRFHFVRLLDTTRFTVDFARHMGRTTDQADSLPVAITNTPAVTANLAGQTLPTVSTVSRALLDRLQVVDIASAAITATTTSAGVSVLNTQGQAFGFAVTAISGTTPTLDVSIQESLDGTNWKTIYDFERVTANGYFTSPLLQIKGSQIRYVRTVGGATPSITMAAFRIQASTEGLFIRRMFDRTINPLTLSSVTPSLDAESATAVQLTVSLGACTTVPSYILQSSEDGATWTNIGATLAGIASAQAQAVVTGFMGKFVRAIVTTAGTGVTQNFVVLKAIR